MSSSLLQSWLSGSWAKGFDPRDLRAYCDEAEQQPNGSSALFVSLYPTPKSLNANESQLQKLFATSVDRIADKKSQAKSIDRELYAGLSKAFKERDNPLVLRTACALAIHEELSAVSVKLVGVALSNAISSELQKTKTSKPPEKLASLLKLISEHIKDVEHDSVLHSLISLKTGLAAHKFREDSIAHINTSSEWLSNHLKKATSRLIDCPFNLPLGDPESLYSGSVFVVDDVVGNIGPVNISFSETQLHESFRSGALASLARNSWKEFVLGLLSDALIYVESANAGQLSNQESWGRLFLQGLSTDDLGLSGRSVVAFSDLKRVLSNKGAASELPALDPQLVKGAGLAFANRKYVLGKSLIDYKAIAVRNRVILERYFDDSNGKVKGVRECRDKTGLE